MTNAVQHLSWNEIPTQTLNPLLKRQFLHGTEGMLARLELKKGCVVPRHAHANEQISFIAEGALRFTIGPDGDTEQRIVRAGEVLVLPANVPHAAEALEDTLDFDLFAPPRQDWIDGSDQYLRQRDVNTA